jgi:hypothetical protein
MRGGCECIVSKLCQNIFCSLGVERRAHSQDELRQQVNEIGSDAEVFEPVRPRSVARKSMPVLYTEMPRLDDMLRQLDAMIKNDAMDRAS